MPWLCCVFHCYLLASEAIPHQLPFMTPAFATNLLLPHIQMDRLRPPAWLEAPLSFLPSPTKLLDFVVLRSTGFVFLLLLYVRPPDVVKGSRNTKPVYLKTKKSSSLCRKKQEGERGFEPGWRPQKLNKSQSSGHTITAQKTQQSQGLTENVLLCYREGCQLSAWICKMPELAWISLRYSGNLKIMNFVPRLFGG